MFLAACDAAWTATASSLTCSGTLSQVDTSSFLPVFDVSTLDPAVIGYAFGAGFSIAATAYLIGKGFSFVLSFLKRIR